MLNAPSFPRYLAPILFLSIACFGMPGHSAAQSIFDSVRVAGRGEVYFASGQAVLDAAAQAALDTFMYAWEKRGPSAAVRITAHTDSIGGGENNLALSRRRAEAVQQALQERGLPAGLIRLAYFGERQPVATNASESGRQHNRRATLEWYNPVPMTPYSGQVKDKNTGAGIAATVHFSTRTLRDSVRTDTSGRFAVQLPTDSTVKIETFAQGYFFNTVAQRMFGTPEMLKRMNNRPAELTLTPALAGEKAILNNLFFIGDQAVLLKSSEPELPKILKFMQINPDLCVEIAGHINHPGVLPAKLEKWEWALSVNRAKLVYNYLVTHGIPIGRMIYRGYGNTEMLFPELTATLDQMEQNRRVEIRVLGKEQ